MSLKASILRNVGTLFVYDDILMHYVRSLGQACVLKNKSYVTLSQVVHNLISLILLYGS